MTDSATTRTQTFESAPSLAEQLLSPTTFPHLMADSKALIAAEMKKKGVALRTGFNVVQKAKPDLVDRALHELLPEFIHAIEPLYSDYRAQNRGNLRDYLLAHQHAVADAMLTVADRRAAKIQNRTVLSFYNKLRGRAEREIIDVLPGIATLIAKYAQ